jgi:amino acid transporter
VVAFVVGLIVFLPFPSWQQLVGFITSATVLSFASGPLVMAALRKQIPDHERPFRVPGGHVIPFLAFWAANLIIYWSTWPINWKLFVAVLIGFVLLGVFHLTGQVKAERYDLKAGASWTIPWLAGLALISYLGDYGGTGLIGFGWAIPVLFVFSAVIYGIAYAFALPPEQIQRYIDDAQAEAAAEEEELGAQP